MKSFDSPFRVKRKYLKKLSAYAERNHAALKLAIYFSTLNEWVLLSSDAFFEDGSDLAIDFGTAMARNEMSRLGDRRIGTLPPLELELRGYPEDEDAIVGEDGCALFTIRHVNMRCAGRAIEAENEKRIAFFLMRYGQWPNSEQPAEVKGGKLVSTSFIFAPESSSEGQQFQIIGSLSSMVSNAFRELTVDEGGSVVALDIEYDPDLFWLDIPTDYEGEALPLWRFEIQPNFDFSS